MAGITGIGEDAGKLAGTLTNETSSIYAFDDKNYWKEGKTFDNLNPLREGLSDILAKKEADRSDDEKKIVGRADTLVKQLEAANKAADKPANDKNKYDAEIPFARIVEIANQYFTVGEYDKGNILLEYGIGRAKELKETDVEKDLTEYKGAIDKHYKKAKAMGLEEKQDFNRFDTMLTNMDKIELDSKIFNTAPGGMNKSKGPSFG